MLLTRNPTRQAIAYGMLLPRWRSSARAKSASACPANKA
jgi:hypothetical protein